MPLESLIRIQLAHFADFLDNRIVLSGPSLEIKAAAAQSFGIVLHELSTNAAKYGALSVPAGRVTIDWRVEKLNGGEPEFHIRWAEHNVFGVQPPTNRGFGSTVLEGFARMSLKAETCVQFSSSGLLWDLRCGLGHVVEHTGTSLITVGAPISPDPPRVAGGRPRVLVVEDEALPAMEIVSVLNEAGFDVLGPAASVRTALTCLADSSGCDAAMLDINLGSETSEPIARKLLDSGIPFVVISGYSREQLPSIFAGERFVSKPLNHDQLLDELRQITHELQPEPASEPRALSI